MKRMGMVIRLRPERAAEYKRLHAEVWPSVLARIAACHIRNYSIFLREPENLLFATLDYHGDDFGADMLSMAAHRETQRWWSLTDPCQQPLESRGEDEWWAAMTEVFHVD